MYIYISAISNCCIFGLDGPVIESVFCNELIKQVWFSKLFSILQIVPYLHILSHLFTHVYVLICVRGCWTCYCCGGDGDGCHGSGLDLYC